MNKPLLTKNRIIAAYFVAATADVIEFPITYIESFHFEFTHLLGEFADVIVDSVVFGIMTILLGFNFAFLPSFFVEAIPELDMCPTWIACVAFVVWKRKEEAVAQAHITDPLRTNEIQTLQNVTEANASGVKPPPLLTLTNGNMQKSMPSDGAIGTRLKSLSDLHDRHLISQSEYETKRQQILYEV